MLQVMGLQAIEQPAEPLITKESSHNGSQAIPFRENGGADTPASGSTLASGNADGRPAVLTPKQACSQHLQSDSHMTLAVRLAPSPTYNLSTVQQELRWKHSGNSSRGAAWSIIARLTLHVQVKAAERQERAAKIISLTSLILLLLAVSMYATILYTGFNPYIAAAALFCAGAAGYPLLTMLTHAVASQTSRSFKRLGPYDRYFYGCLLGGMDLALGDCATCSRCLLLTRNVFGLVTLWPLVHYLFNRSES